MYTGNFSYYAFWEFPRSQQLSHKVEIIVTAKKSALGNTEVVASLPIWKGQNI